MKIDVVIPTGKNIYESNYSICYTIRSILSQTIQPNCIYIVENIKNLYLSDVLCPMFGNHIKIIDGTEKSPNISYARNLGISHCTSDIIVLMDDDIVLGYNNYFDKIINILSHNDFCCGAKRYWTHTNWYNYLKLDYLMNHNLLILKDKSFLPYSINRDNGEPSCHDFSFIGNFGAIRRNILTEVDGFDEEYIGWLYQDTDLMMRLCYKGYKYEILSYSNIFCYHLAHSANKQTFMELNKNRFVNKQNELGIKFHTTNFFGRFNNELTDVITYKGQ